MKKKPSCPVCNVVMNVESNEFIVDYPLLGKQVTVLYTCPNPIKMCGRYIIMGKKVSS